MNFASLTGASLETSPIAGRKAEEAPRELPAKLKPWPGAVLPLRDGRTLYIRAARQDEVPRMLEYFQKFLDGEHDFHGNVGARVYAEVLDWYRKNLKASYILVGLIDGAWVSFANGRLLSADIHLTQHTLTLVRSGDIGAAMFYARALYGFDILDCRESWSTADGCGGWVRWGQGLARPSCAWPNAGHGLSGMKVYYITRKYWDILIQESIRQMAGGELDFAVPDAVRKANGVLRLPEVPAVESQPRG